MFDNQQNKHMYLLCISHLTTVISEDAVVQTISYVKGLILYSSWRNVSIFIQVYT